MPYNPFEITPHDLDDNPNLLDILRMFQYISGSDDQELKGIYRSRYFLVAATVAGALRWKRELAQTSMFHRDLKEQVPENHGVIVTTVAAVRNSDGSIVVEGWLLGATENVVKHAGHQVPVEIVSPHIVVGTFSEEYTLSKVGWHAIELGMQRMVEQPAPEPVLVGSSVAA